LFVTLCKKINILAPTGNSNTICPLSIPYTSHYTEYDTPIQEENYINEITGRPAYNDIVFCYTSSITSEILR
jgi:hypothetical protein